VKPFDPPPVQWAPCDDARLAYGRAGETGPPVLLIMGFTMPGAAWRFQIEDLARDHRVVWFDNRGSGQTEAPVRPWSMGRFAADTGLLMDHLGWETAHVVGVSMGGMIAQEFGVENTQRLRSLSLLATHPGGRTIKLPPRRGLRHFLTTQLAPGRRRRGQALARLLFPQEWLESVDREWLRSILVADFGAPPPVGHRLAQLAAVSRHDTRRRLRRLAGTRTLILKPCQDLLVNPKHNDTIHRLIPNSRLIEIPDAGHGLIRQAADQVNTLLRAHFAAD